MNDRYPYVDLAYVAAVMTDIAMYQARLTRLLWLEPLNEVPHGP